MSSFHKIQSLKRLSAFRILPTIPQPIFAFFIPHSAIPHFTNDGDRQLMDKDRARFLAAALL